MAKLEGWGSMVELAASLTMVELVDRKTEAEPDKVGTKLEP